ncbi:MAG: MBL fold metallo-hydrolase, partial [Candidatus Poseidoniales archaeon]
MKVVRLPAIHHDANAVFISGKDKSILIDTGTAWYQSLQVERLKSHLDRKTLDMILLSSRRYPCCG